MNRLEYVASGTSHSKMHNKPLRENEEALEIVNNSFSRINGAHGHDFSLLFNAFIEKQYGLNFKNHYKDSIHKIHADSGGLQIITQGKKITDELKKQIYTTQANYSDIAMCFDEIPVTVVAESSDRNDTTGRFFDKENLEHYAKKTGQNIKEQIELFIEQKTTSKPMIICQGNCYDTYMIWMDTILGEIPDEYYDHIAGIAMGAAALGTGPLEDIERAAYAGELVKRINKNYIHILGVGSTRRMLPYLTFMQNNFYDKNLKLSYDSTTHMSGISLGLYYFEGSILKINRHYSKMYQTIYNDVSEKFELDFDSREFHKLLNNNSQIYQVNNSIDNEVLLRYYKAFSTFICSSIENFMERINNCLESKSYLMEAAYDEKVFLEINSLLNVNSIEDFNLWKSQCGSSVKSSRISDSRPTSLSQFFGD